MADVLEENRMAISVTECAKLLSISRATAFARVKDGTIPAVRCGGRWLVPIKRLEEYLSTGDTNDN